jgi:hypothetical protein
MKKTVPWFLAAAALIVCTAPGSSMASDAVPRTLDECYMQVAMEKSTADMAYVAKDLCDQVFGTRPLSVIVLDTKARQCVEWWFDNRGRHESPERYCAIENTTADQMTLSCEEKDRRKGAFVLKLGRSAEAFSVIQKAGNPPGAFYPTVSSCVAARLKQ